MDDKNKYKTIVSPTSGDFRDRGSKFLSYAFPIKLINEVKEHIQLLKKEHPKAVHYCFAFRIGTDGLQYRANDDGEPAGSAGKPILGQIYSMGITNILVVVVRYFGGTLLGVPGLINAYKNATQLALNQAITIDKWKEVIYDLECDYSNIGEILYLLKQAEATVYKQDMQLFCKIQTGVPIPYVEASIQKISTIRGVTFKISSLEN